MSTVLDKSESKAEVKRGRGRPKKIPVGKPIGEVYKVEPKDVTSRKHSANILTYAKALGFIAVGNTVDKALELAGGSIDASTFWRIKSSSVQFDNMYYEAIKNRAEILAERVEEECMMADEKSANACRVKLELMKWRLSKLCPKRYGDVPQGTTQIAIQVAWKGNEDNPIKITGAVSPDALKNGK